MSAGVTCRSTIRSGLPLGGTDETHTDEPRAAFAAWLALTAPGALVTHVILLGALVAVPWFTPLVRVSLVARSAAAVLCGLQLAGTVLLLRQARSRVWSLFVLGLLGVEGLLCGWLITAEPYRLGLLLAVAVLVTSLEVGGGSAALLGLVAVGIGAGVGQWWGSAAGLLLPTTMHFPTTLSVDTTFAGTPVLTGPAWSFPTTLSVETVLNRAAAAGSSMSFATTLDVETMFGGRPAMLLGDELVLPLAALVLLALSGGMAVTLWRLRKVRIAVAASIVAAARVAP